MEDQPRQAPEPKSIPEKVDFVRNIVSFFAIPLLALRPMVGFDLVNPNWLIFHCGLMILWAKLSGGSMLPTFVPGQPVAPPLSMYLFAGYAITVFIVGMRRRHAAWKEIVRGEQYDSWSPGESWLERWANAQSWVPAGMLEHRRITRWVEPLLIYLGGLLSMCVSPPMGISICFSAIALRIYEERVYQNSIREIVRVNNAGAALKAHQVLTRMMKGEVGAKPTLKERGGVPVGGAIPELLANQVRLRHYEEEQARLRAVGGTSPL